MSTTSPGMLSHHPRRWRPLVGLLLGAILTASAGAKAPPQAGDTPPEDLGKTATGERVKLTDYRGKVLIVSFWASWCPPCRKELPVLASIQKQATRNHLVVFAVNWKEDRDRFRQLVKALKDVDLNYVSDSYGYFGEKYGVKAIPHMIIIGRDGKIAAVHVGYGESEIPQLVKEINGLLTATSTPADALPTQSP